MRSTCWSLLVGILPLATGCGVKGTATPPQAGPPPIDKAAPTKFATATLALG